MKQSRDIAILDIIKVQKVMEVTGTGTYQAVDNWKSRGIPMGKYIKLIKWLDEELGKRIKKRKKQEAEND